MRHVRHTARFAVYAVGLLLAVSLVQCGGAARKVVTLKGSDTMVILGQRWAETYMAAHPGQIIQVTGGGSGTGIAALINGTTDICQSSRPMKADEKQQLAAKFGQDPVEQVVARDGLTIYVSEQCPVDEMTLAQVRGIYTGQIRDWAQLGGPAAPVIAYSRENNSGTYAYFKEHVLDGGDFAADVQTLPGTAAVVNAVTQDARGIGYGGDAYAKGVKMISLKVDDATPGVTPSEAAIADGSYPLARPLYFYTRTTPTGDLKAFIDYCLSPEGQRVVRDVGYFPIP